MTSPGPQVSTATAADSGIITMLRGEAAGTPFAPWDGAGKDEALAGLLTGTMHLVRARSGPREPVVACFTLQPDGDSELWPPDGSTALYLGSVLVSREHVRLGSFVARYASRQARAASRTWLRLHCATGDLAQRACWADHGFLIHHADQRRHVTCYQKEASQ